MSASDVPADSPRVAQARATAILTLAGNFSIASAGLPVNTVKGPSPGRRSRRRAASVSDIHGRMSPLASFEVVISTVSRPSACAAASSTSSPPIAPLVTYNRPGPASRPARASGAARAPTLVRTRGRPDAIADGPSWAAAGTPAHSTMTSKPSNILGEGEVSMSARPASRARPGRSTTSAP